MSIGAFLTPQDWLRADGGPRYLQLQARLSEAVECGLLTSGSALPPEREIAAITQLSRVTVRKAIQSLVANGMVVQRQGSGSFIAPAAPQLEQSSSRLTSFSEDMIRRGMTPRSEWLDRGVFVPSPDEVLALALPPDGMVSRINRLRIADDKPMAIERASLSTAILPDPSVVETSLYEVLARSGHRPMRALQKISAIGLRADDAALLSVPVGVAALRIERVSYVADGRVVEFTQSVYRGDAYNFVAELRLADTSEKEDRA